MQETVAGLKKQVAGTPKSEHSNAMEKIKNPSFKLIGLQLAYKTTNENGQAAIDCGNLWRRFEAEKIAELVPGKLDDALYAVYFDYEKDETMPYSYFIDCKVDDATNAPAGLDELLIPSQQYCKIPVQGVMTQCVSDAWKKIWPTAMDRQFGFDFEVYDHRSRDWNHAELDIFISVNN